MPRLKTGQVFRQLTTLFRNNKEVSIREIRWLWDSLEHVKSPQIKISQWDRLCRWRLQGVPLQYLCGTQPFGPLEILCRPHVLIPRWETEEWVMDLNKGISRWNQETPFNLVDLCTGTGCIPLSLIKMDQKRNERLLKNVLAMDISPYSLNLVRRNIVQNHLQKFTNLEIQRGNILQQDIFNSLPIEYQDYKIDILTCNPPYIPSSTFAHDVQDSVKRFEPHLALIGDLEFYENLINVWLPYINSFVYELGSWGQMDYIKKQIIKINQMNKDPWKLGIKFDSNNKLRCVYGFKMKMTYIFQHFGQLIIQ